MVLEYNASLYKLMIVKIKCFKSLSSETQMKLRSLRAAMQSGNAMLSYFSYVLGTVADTKRKRNQGMWTLSRQLSLGLYEHGHTFYGHTDWPVKQRGWGGKKDSPTSAWFFKDLCPRHFHSLHNLSTTGVSYLLYTWYVPGTMLITLLFHLILTTILRQMLIFLYPF